MRNIFAWIFPLFTAITLASAGIAYGASPLRLDQMKMLDEEFQEDPVDQKEPDLKEKAKKLPPINMVFIKGGCFDMGDFKGMGDEDERPVHEVCVSDFYLSETEVTQELWEAVSGNKAKDPKKPVTNVNWSTVKRFIKELNRITNGYYRLPTEAEWEYAARAGGRKLLWPGTDNEQGLHEYAWFADNAENELKNVKTRRANALGLYDMSGNVWEWTEDNFDFDFYKNSPKDNPYGPDFSKWKVVRGGSYLDDSIRLRTTYRYGFDPALPSTNIGFRLAE